MANFKDISRKVELNSRFDDSLEERDLRLIKTEFIDESDSDFNDHEYEETLENVGDNAEYDLECYSQRLYEEPKWESIIKYKKMTSGSKTRNARRRIQRILAKIFETSEIKK